MNVSTYNLKYMYLNCSNILSRIRTKFYPEFPASALFAEINDMEIVTTSLLLFVCNQRVLLIQKHQQTTSPENDTVKSDPQVLDYRRVNLQRHRTGTCSIACLIFACHPRCRTDKDHSFCSLEFVMCRQSDFKKKYCVLLSI